MTEDQWRSKTVMPLLRKSLPTGVWAVYPRTRYARSGVADILGSYNGFIAIELKWEKSDWELTQLQRAYLRDVVRSGGRSFVAWNNQDIYAIIEHLSVGAIIEPADERFKRGGAYIHGYQSC